MNLETQQDGSRDDRRDKFHRIHWLSDGEDDGDARTRRDCRRNGIGGLDKWGNYRHRQSFVSDGMGLTGVLGHEYTWWLAGTAWNNVALRLDDTGHTVFVSHLDRAGAHAFGDIAVDSAGHVITAGFSTEHDEDYWFHGVFMRAIVAKHTLP